MTITYSQTKGDPFFNGTVRGLSEATSTGADTTADLPANTTRGDNGATVPSTALSLDGLSAVTVFAKLNAGTFSGGAKVEAYVFDPKAATWGRAAEMDRNIAEGFSNCACEPIKVVGRSGWLVFLAVGWGGAGTLTIGGLPANWQRN
jgi:hypothetical protein